MSDRYRFQFVHNITVPGISLGARVFAWTEDLRDKDIRIEQAKRIRQAIRDAHNYEHTRSAQHKAMAATACEKIAALPFVHRVECRTSNDDSCMILA